MATAELLGMSLGTNLLSVALLLVCFAVLRSKEANARVYFPKAYLAPTYSGCARAGRAIGSFKPKIFTTYYSWVPDALRMSEREIIRDAGLDSAVYLRIYILGLKIFTPITVIALLVLIPLNATGGKSLDISGIEKLSILNISPRSNMIFIHITMVYIFTFWTCFMLYKEYSKVASMRLEFLQSQIRSPDQFTVLVRNIPGDSCHSPEIVNEFFHRNHPDQYLGQQAVYKTNRYAKLVKRKENLLNWLDYYELKRNSLAYVVAKLTFLTITVLDQLRELDRRMVFERQRILSDPKSILPAFFVIFDSRWGASICAQTQQSQNPTQWVTEWAPEPRDVYWDNLSIQFISLTIRKFLIPPAVFVLIFLNMIPIALVHALFSIDSIKEVPAFVRLIKEVKVMKSFLEGFVPNLALDFFLHILQEILMFMSKLEGHVSVSSLERMTASKYYYFMIVNVFLGSIVAGLAFDYSFSNNSPAEIARAIVLVVATKATFFITYIMVDGWAGCASELLRLIPLVKYHLKNVFIVKTQRDRERAMNPGSIGLWKTLPSLQLYFLIGLVYAVVAPILLLFITIFFAFAFIVYRNQIANVYIQKYESAASFWPQMHSRIIASLMISHLILLGLLSTMISIYYIPILIFLPLATLWFQKYCKIRFEPAFRKYPLEEAMEKDQKEHALEPDLNIKTYLENAYLHPVFKKFDQQQQQQQHHVRS